MVCLEVTLLQERQEGRGKGTEDEMKGEVLVSHGVPEDVRVSVFECACVCVCVYQRLSALLG